MRNIRAVSDVLGYALIFSLVITTVAVVSVGGLGQLQEARNVEQLNNAERAFDLLKTNMDDLTKRGAPSRSTEIRLADAQLAVSDPITISFEAEDVDTPANNFSESYEVWPIIYRSAHSDATVVYAGGGLFRTEKQGGVVVEAPPFVAESGRIVVPLAHTRSRGGQSIGGGTARVRAVRSNVDLLASDTAGTYDRVSLNVSSPRATLWHRALSRYDAFDCDLDESTTPNRADCRVSDPDRLHISLVKVDLELSS